MADEAKKYIADYFRTEYHAPIEAADDDVLEFARENHPEKLAAIQKFYLDSHGTGHTDFLPEPKQSIPQQALQAMDEFAKNFNEGIEHQAKIDPIASAIWTGTQLGKLGAKGLRKIDDFLLGPGAESDRAQGISTPLDPIADMLPQSHMQTFLAAPQLLEGMKPINGRVPLSDSPNHINAENIKLGYPVTPAEQTGNGLLGGLEKFLGKIGGGRPIDELKMVRADMRNKRAATALEATLQKELEHLQALGEDAKFEVNKERAAKIADIQERLTRASADADNAFFDEQQGTLGQTEPLDNQISRRTQEANKASRMAAEGKDAVESKFPANETDKQSGLGAIRAMAARSAEKKVSVRQAYSDYGEALAAIGQRAKASNLRQVVNDRLTELNQAIKTAPNSALANRLTNLLAKIQTVGERGDTANKMLDASQLAEFERDLNFMLAKEGYRNTNLEGVSGGTSKIGSILEEMKSAVRQDLDSLPIPKRQAENIKSLGDKARQEAIEFFNDFRSRGVKALKNKDPQDILDYAMSSDTKFSDLKRAMGDEGIQKLREANFRRLFTRLMSSDNPEAVLKEHFGELSNNKEVIDGLYSAQDVEDLHKLAYGRAHSSSQYLEDTGKLIAKQNEAETASAQRLKSIRENEAKTIGSLEAEKSNVEQTASERLKEIDRQNSIKQFQVQQSIAEKKEAAAKTIFGQRETDREGRPILRRAGEKAEQRLDNIMNVASGVGLGAAGLGHYGAGLGVASVAQALRLTPGMMTRIYLSPAGRKFLINAVNAKGTPAEAEALMRLGSYVSTQKVFSRDFRNEAK